eukprot:CAMPEP_0203749662 /NCGR_PEP_ID=MMETSP0098-20131031/4138_1 /ASSEMBLY_ACC=CAM_ASM_000208 /TAXON_ID=96639 /ORGANISM=" , Strain NY0313808BC1" /LENGTH=505 /DNA_ID=CAMNT_0050638755 /DNA_START=110 /DNA_END=1627 /DNA_ORIENTATION=-
MYENAVGTSQAKQEPPPGEEKHADGKGGLPKLWKEDPDLYFSWALSLGVIAGGHVLVDLLPDNDQLYTLTSLETAAIGKKFERAAREYLDTKNVTRVVCEEDMTADYFFYLFATAVQQNSQGGKSTREEKPSSRFKRGDRERTRQSTYNVKSSLGGLKPHKTSKIAKRGSLAQAAAPFVLILQDMHLLPHETQLALVEIFSRKTMPVAFASFLRGMSISNTGDSTMLVPGNMEINIPHIVVGLCTTLQVPTLDYICVSEDETNICPELFQSFLMRIPIKLPERSMITANKAKYNQNFRDDASGTLEESWEYSGNPGEELFRKDSVSSSRRRSTVHGEMAYDTKGGNKPRIFLWENSPSTITVGSYSIPAPATKTYCVMKVDLSPEKEKTASVHISSEMETHLYNIITALRMHPYVLSGPSSRCLTLLQNCAKVVASFTHNRDFVTPLDITDVVIEVLAHQIIPSFRSVPENQLPERSSHPKDWHPLTAARYIVATTIQFYVPTPR